MFHLQTRYKPIIDYAKELKDEQSLPSLRDDMNNLNEQRRKQTETVEGRLLAEIKKLQNVNEDL